jgi:hypothetical protein
MDRDEEQNPGSVWPTLYEHGRAIAEQGARLSAVEHRVDGIRADQQRGFDRVVAEAAALRQEIVALRTETVSAIPANVVERIAAAEKAEARASAWNKVLLPALVTCLLGVGGLIVDLASHH